MMIEVEVECECGTVGWFEIKDEAYVTICPCCHKAYKINNNGVVDEVKSRPTKPAKSGTPLFDKDMFNMGE